MAALTRYVTHILERHVKSHKRKKQHYGIRQAPTVARPAKKSAEATKADVFRTCVPARVMARLYEVPECTSYSTAPILRAATLRCHHPARGQMAVT